MRVIKFNQFISVNENVHDTPEEYVKLALMKIKNKIEKLFSGQINANDVEKMSDRKNREDGKNFSDLGLELQSSEMSRFSKTLDNVKFKYTDEKYLYDLTISIALEEAVPDDTEKDFSDDDIKNCNVKFKKYDQDNFNLIGQITKTVKIEEVNDNLLLSLKIELDEKFGSEDEEFEIETE